MTKLSLDNVGNLGGNPTGAESTINANYALIEAAIENTLSRDGTSPNPLEATLDANNNTIINLPAAATDTEPVRKAEFDDLDAEVDALLPTIQAAEASALAAKNAAQASASSASISAANALASETNLGLEVEYAEEWAQKAEDVPVSVDAGGDGATDFSSLHWAAKAAGAVAGVNLPPISPGDADKFLQVLDTEDGYELVTLSFLTETTADILYQPLDSDLTAISALDNSDGNFIVGSATGWVVESDGAARASLGLGTGDSPQFTNLALTGYQDITEISTPSNPAADVARMYAFDDGGTTRLAFRDSSGTETVFGGGTAADITFTPSGSIGSANVQDAIEELDTEKAALTGATFTGPVTVQNDITAQRQTTSTTSMIVGKLGSSGVVGQVLFTGLDSGANNTNYALLNGAVVDATDTSEDGEFNMRTVQAGELTTSITVRQGLFASGATGGDQGIGSVNAELFDDGAAVCMALEYLVEGQFDVDRWDAMVPDKIFPEERYTVPLEEEVDGVTLTPAADGSLIAKRERVKRPVMDRIPVFDEDGNGIDMIEEPAVEELIVPERRIKQQHRTAHLFKAMLDEGFDPRDPAQYLARLRRDRALPGMPTEAEFADRQARAMDGEKSQKLSVSEKFERMWLAVELLALSFDTLHQRVEKLENAQ